jgi:hypothetical protein
MYIVIYDIAFIFIINNNIVNNNIVNNNIVNNNIVNI